MVVLIPAMLFAFYAQGKVKSTFNKYSRVGNMNRYTGAEIAAKVLNSAGIYDVKVEKTKGRLTDHYDPTKKVVRLSESVYNSTSVAAIGVAAHECGHAIQDAQGYSFLRFRHAIFPLVSFSSNLAVPLIFIGVLIEAMQLAQIGVILFGAVVLFQLVTLPVEFNASNRAIGILSNQNYLAPSEVEPAKKVLNAAALTYVAAAVVAIANLLRFILILRGGRND
jgi:hypothetical protein